MFDIGVMGILSFGVVKLVQSGIRSVVFPIAPPEARGLGGARVGMLLLSQELVYVGYLTGRELLVIQLLEDIIASLYRIVVGCAVYLRAVQMVPYGIAVTCHKVGCKPCVVPWVIKLDVDHKGAFLLFQKVEG